MDKIYDITDWNMEYLDVRLIIDHSIRIGVGKTVKDSLDSLKEYISEARILCIKLKNCQKMIVISNGHTHTFYYDQFGYECSKEEFLDELKLNIIKC